MAFSSFIHPSPTIPRQIQHLLCASISLSIVILAFSMVFLGTASYFLAEISFLASMAHNITLLVLSAKERKQTPEALVGQLPATSTKAAIICTWLVAFLWTATFALVLTMTIIFTKNGDLDSHHDAPIIYIEWILELAEVIVTIFIALKCTCERQRIVGLTETAKWYQLGNYTS